MSFVIDNASGDLLALAGQLKNRERLNKVIATAATNLVKDHFAKLAMSNRNKFGVRGTFWKRMRGATREESNVVQAAVAMPHEIAQRRYGGPIRPTGGRKMLTIPIAKEAYGKSAREFDNLVVVRFKDENRAYLAQISRPTLLVLRSVGPQKKDRIKLMYALKAFVMQSEDPSILPTDEEFHAVIKKTIQTYIQRRTGGAA